MRTALARCAAALLCAACTKAPPGRKLASGLARGLVARAGSVAFLLEAHRPDDPLVPDDLYVGDLWLDDRKVGSAVSSVEGGYAFSPDGSRLAFLAAWRFREGDGDLWVAPPGEDPKRVARGVRAFAWSSKNELGWVRENMAGFGNRDVTGSRLQAFLWSPDGKRVALRAGGTLRLIDAQTGSEREIAAAVSDFAFAADGAIAALGPPPPGGGDRPLLVDGVRAGAATSFAFSPDGRELALLSTQKQPGEAAGDLYRAPRSGASPRLVATRVADWRWGPAGDLLCLSRYDLRSRAGTLVASTAEGATQELAARVQGFSISGRRVLFVVQSPQKNDFKLELWGKDLAAPDAAPHRIDEGVYGWQLSPDGATLYYKARCAGGARSCSLLRVPFSGGEPQLLAPGVAGFDLSADGSRILVQKPHPGAPRAVDLAVISPAAAAGEPVKPFVEEADPGSRFADAAGRKVAYAIVAAGKGGVFLADVP